MTNPIVSPFTASDAHLRDILGRVKMSRHQNLFEADFEYGPQPLRWESLTAGSATVTHLPGEGGVRLRVTSANGDVAMRQSRPYHRYQPGKTMFMASAVVFGPAISNQRQRIGFFDDGNGVFFEDAGPSADNPSGMGVVFRSDVSGLPTDTRIEAQNWNGDPNVRALIDWSRIQMVFIEYAWYGAGMVRWGVFLNGQPYTLHQIGFGNRTGQTRPWARTGNLPVRYEIRNIAAVTAAQNDMIHYGVSVICEGGIDDQRGFTYSYGMAPATPRRTVALSTTRFPVLSIRGRNMGTVEFTQASGAVTSGSTTSMTVSGTPFTAGALVGRGIFFPGLGGGNGLTARITANTTNTVTFADIVTGGALGTAVAASQAYQIGLINRGQLLPRRLFVSATNVAVIELIASTPASPISLTGASWAALSALGSGNSFAERDVSATALSGGEVVMAFTAPAGGSGLQDIDLRDLFPLYNTVRGNNPDILTVAVTTPSAAATDVGAHLVCQEAMS